MMTMRIPTMVKTSSLVGVVFVGGENGGDRDGSQVLLDLVCFLAVAAGALALALFAGGGLL